MKFKMRLGKLDTADQGIRALNEVVQETTRKFQMNRKQVVLDTPVWFMSFLLCKYKD